MEPAEKPSEFKLRNTAEDGITKVSFSPNSSQYLLVSSWDSTVRLHDIVADSMRAKFTLPYPVLDCCFQDSGKAFCGGLDKTLTSLDINKMAETAIGSHDDTIQSVLYSADTNVIVTGSWDQTIKLWDPRSSTCIGSYVQPNKVYTMDISGDCCVVGTAGRHVLVWDLRNMGYVLQRRESSLKYQTRCIRCFPNKQGFVLSSIEGRVAVEYLDPKPEIQKKKYAFKCHRLKENGVELIYPVNAVAFHNAYNTFATGGSDGYVTIWDAFNKKRLCQFHRYPTSIASLAFSQDGFVLAIASSYMYELGEMEKQPADSIFIRSLTDQETKPK